MEDSSTGPQPKASWASRGHCCGTYLDSQVCTIITYNLFEQSPKGHVCLHTFGVQVVVVGLSPVAFVAAPKWEESQEDCCTEARAPTTLSWKSLHPQNKSESTVESLTEQRTITIFREGVIVRTRQEMIIQAMTMRIRRTTKTTIMIPRRRRRIRTTTIRIVRRGEGGRQRDAQNEEYQDQ